MTMTRAKENNHVSIHLLSSLTASTMNAGLFHPWDRALYLAIANHRSFLHNANFANCWQGLGQTLSQKPLTGSFYYFAQSELDTHLTPFLREQYKLNDSSIKFLIGLGAGSFEAILKNPFSTIKSFMWGQPVKQSFRQSTITMYKQGGLKPFANGTAITVARDALWGGFYEVLRYRLRICLSQTASGHTHPDTVKIASDATAAGTATIICSLLNYARTKKYSTEPVCKPPSAIESIGQLFKEVKAQPGLLTKVSLFQNRLAIGWGTTRVAVGMALGQYITEQVKEVFTINPSA